MVKFLADQVCPFDNITCKHCAWSCHHYLQFIRQFLSIHLSCLSIPYNGVFVLPNQINEIIIATSMRVSQAMSYLSITLLPWWFRAGNHHEIWAWTGNYIPLPCERIILFLLAPGFRVPHQICRLSMDFISQWFKKTDSGSLARIQYAQPGIWPPGLLLWRWVLSFADVSLLSQFDYNQSMAISLYLIISCWMSSIY